METQVSNLVARHDGLEERMTAMETRVGGQPAGRVDPLHVNGPWQRRPSGGGGGGGVGGSAAAALVLAAPPSGPPAAEAGAVPANFWAGGANRAFGDGLGARFLEGPGPGADRWQHDGPGQRFPGGPALATAPHTPFVLTRCFVRGFSPWVKERVVGQDTRITEQQAK